MRLKQYPLSTDLEKYFIQRKVQCYLRMVTGSIEATGIRRIRGYFAYADCQLFPNGGLKALSTILLLGALRVDASKALNQLLDWHQQGVPI